MPDSTSAVSSRSLLIGLRRLRFEGAASLVLAGVVLLTSFASCRAATISKRRIGRRPTHRCARRRADQSQHQHRARRQDPLHRTAAMSSRASSTKATTIRQDFPEPIEKIIGEQSYVADTTNFEVNSLPGEPIVPFPRFLRIRYQQDAEANVTSGRGPHAAAGRGDGGATRRRCSADDASCSRESSSPLRLQNRCALGSVTRCIINPVREDPLNVGMALARSTTGLLRGFWNHRDQPAR